MHTLIITDGKMGDLAQCRGVAQALKGKHGLPRTMRIDEHVVVPTLLHRLPVVALPVGDEDGLFQQRPDLIIASGRRTLPFLRRFKIDYASDPPFIAFLKDPRYGHDYLDCIWAPDHDGEDPRLHVRTSLSPHGFDTATLNAARDDAANLFKDLPRPFTTVVLGGQSKKVKWTSDVVDTFTAALSKHHGKGTVLVSGSRRTPPQLAEAVTATLAKRPHWIWDGTGENPFATMLASADEIIVTGDSHNMVSEALAVGQPVRVFRPPGLHAKLNEFLDDLEKRGIIGTMDEGPRTPRAINDTPRIAAAIAARLSMRGVD